MSPQTIPLKGGFSTTDPRLDRVPQFDERSRDYPIRARLPRRIPLRGRTWSLRPRLDQGEEGSCVGHGWAHELAAAPTVVPNITHELAVSIYREAQRRDEWPGESYEGTSVLAGAKAVAAWGFLDEYRWAFSIDDVVDTLVAHGPIVVGTWWLAGMWEPRPSGLLEVSGSKEGGHCYAGRGLLLKPRLKGESRKLGPVIRFPNSWGEPWGVRGECFMRVEDFERLQDDDGEVCVPVRRAVGRFPG